MYLVGKFGATAAFTNVYVITSEMFPTNLRQSFMATCSTFARIGSMIAPQMPLLVSIVSKLFDYLRFYKSKLLDTLKIGERCNTLCWIRNVALK